MRRATLGIPIGLVMVAACVTVAAGHGDATEVLRPVEFSGRIVPTVESVPETVEIVDDVAAYRGGTWRAEAESMSDPRLVGEVTLTANRDHHLGAFGLELSRATIRIDNDDGTWQEAPGLVVDFGDGRASTRTSALIGHGAYEGWITVAQITLDPSTGTLSLEGIILEGALPPDPPEGTAP